MDPLDDKPNPSGGEGPPETTAPPKQAHGPAGVDAPTQHFLPNGLERIIHRNREPLGTATRPVANFGGALAALKPLMVVVMGVGLSGAMSQAVDNHNAVLVSDHFAMRLESKESISTDSILKSMYVPETTTTTSLPTADEQSVATPEAVPETTEPETTTTQAPTTQRPTTTKAVVIITTTTKKAEPVTTTAAPTTTTTAAPTTSTSTTSTSVPLVKSATVQDSETGTGTNQFNYSSGWTVCSDCSAVGNDNTFRIAKTTGNNVTLKFTGRQVKLYGIQGRGYGIATISVDNGTPTTVDLYANKTDTKFTMFTSNTLSTGNHTVKVTLSGNKNAAATNAWINIDKADIYS